MLTWPASRSFWRFEAFSSSGVSSKKYMSCLRVYPVESKAPPLMRASSVLRLKHFASTRFTKSCRLVNGPFSSRSAMMASATLRPTPRTPTSPKRMPSLTGVNSAFDELMSGGNTGVPLWLQLAM